jgi:hypothetical protein
MSTSADAASSSAAKSRDGLFLRSYSCHKREARALSLARRKTCHLCSSRSARSYASSLGRSKTVGTRLMRLCAPEGAPRAVDAEGTAGASGAAGASIATPLASGGCGGVALLSADVVRTKPRGCAECTA